MNLSNGDRSRYRVFRSHFVPRTRVGRYVVGLLLALFLAGQWPLVSLANRQEPTVFGVPLLFVYLAAVYTAQIVVLIYAVMRTR